MYYRVSLLYCLLFCIFKTFIILYVSLYLCSEYLCHVIPGCFALSCPKNFSAQSDPVLFSASDNKRLEVDSRGRWYIKVTHLNIMHHSVHVM